MKHLLILVIMVFAALGGAAQEMRVMSMRMEPMDLTAATQPRLDLNGVPCAVVKVQMPEGAAFEGSIIGTVEYHTGEYWVYMPANSKNLRVKHSSAQPLFVSFADYGVPPLLSKATYVLGIALPVVLNGSVASSMNINGHDYVDLGLPSGTKWATCNLGAPSPERTGKFYSWSGIAPYIDVPTYSPEDMGRLPNICISGNPQYDAATAKWGAPWRLPKKYEWRELIDNCRLESDTENGIKVVRAIGPNGKSIVFPLGGHLWGSKLETPGEGDYWAGDPTMEMDKACSVYIFKDGGTQISQTNKIFGGLSVRPVAD